MNRFFKVTHAALWLLALIALSGCALPGQAASPTPEPVDVNAVMTSAAATAFVELTSVAQQASATPSMTPAPTETPTPAATETPAPLIEATTDPALLSSPTAEVGGLPATETPAVMAGTPAAPVVPTLTPVAPKAAFSGPGCLSSRFVADLTVPDGTVLQPYQKFTKAWTIQNTGTCSWDQGFGFVWWAGPDMGGTAKYFSNNDQPVVSGGTVDIYIDMRAPTKPGDYVAHWAMVDDAGKTFGGDFTVAIKVK